MNAQKLNLGCGRDYRTGYFNIDADPATNPDRILNLESERLIHFFLEESVQAVLANDVLEHLFHWRAVTTLKDIFWILEPGGWLNTRMPHAALIIEARIPVIDKIPLLFGGQDIPVDSDPVKNKARAQHPEFFAHKYAWTPGSFHVELERIGFTDITSTTAWPNFSTTARKPPKTQVG